VISDLVSELFNHINSKEAFNYISDLLINSLREYKKKFPLEYQTTNIDKPLDEIEEKESSKSNYNFSDSKIEYLSVSNDIHSILSNCQDLTNTQKLDFCNNQRYFMKLYLKEVVININKNSLDH
jgi:hypothetical protein